VPKFAVAFFCLSIMGCGHLRPDPVMPSIEANYSTVELLACGQRWSGLGICSVIEGEKYSTINLKIQAFHEGMMTVYSKNCQVDTTLSYSGSQEVPIHIQGAATRNCLVTVTVSPVYPDEPKQDIRVYSQRGHLAIVVLGKDDDWKGFTRKVTGNFSSSIRLWVGPTASATLVADGCGREESYEAPLKVFNGYAAFDMKDVVPPGILPKTCVLEGYVRSEYPDVRFNIIMNKYDEKYIPLPIPVVTLDKSTLRVKANKAVSIITLDKEYDIDYETKFKKFNATKPHVLRLITVKGRMLIGEWDVPEQKWEWKR